MNPEQPINDVRWLPILNDSSDLDSTPPGALVRPVSMDVRGVITINKPNEDSSKFLMVNSPGKIAIGKLGSGSIDYPLMIYYEELDGTPAVGEQWGSERGSWKLRKGKTGFLILGDPDTENHLVPAMLEVCRFD